MSGNLLGYCPREVIWRRQSVSKVHSDRALHLATKGIYIFNINIRKCFIWKWLSASGAVLTLLTVCKFAKRHPWFADRIHLRYIFWRCIYFISLFFWVERVRSFFWLLGWVKLIINLYLLCQITVYPHCAEDPSALVECECAWGRGMECISSECITWYLGHHCGSNSCWLRL